MKYLYYILMETKSGNWIFTLFLKLLYDIFWMVGFCNGFIKRIFRRLK